MAERITYPAKTNNPSDPDSINKYFATEAVEVKNVVNSHADNIDDHDIRIENLEVAQSANPYYYKWDSLALLQSAYPVGEENAWALIDKGAGVSIQIAEWNTVTAQWELQNVVEDKVYVTNFSSLPAPGTAGKFYITLDKFNIYIWHSGQYNKIGGVEYATATAVSLKQDKVVQEIFVATSSQTVFNLTNSPNNVDVFVGRTFQIEGVDFNIEGAIVTFTYDLDAGDKVTIRKF